MPATDMPAAEVDVSVALVRALLVEQHDDLARHAIVPLANGWDNAVFRIGDELVGRFPRRALGAALVEHEQRWLPELAPTLPLPVPVPIRVGLPGCGYPWGWSVCRWLPGRVAADEPPGDLGLAAATLGHFLAVLHRPAPVGAPANPYRGVPLLSLAAATEQRIDQLDGLIPVARVRRLWLELMETKPWPGPRLWVHGDIHPANLLVDRGVLSAVLDWGDLTAGDPSSDLAAGWMLFPPAERATFRQAAGPVDDDTWTRARGWAVSLGAAFLANSADNPTIAGIGRTMLAAALES